MVVPIPPMGTPLGAYGHGTRRYPPNNQLPTQGSYSRLRKHVGVHVGGGLTLETLAARKPANQLKPISSGITPVSWCTLLFRWQGGK